MFSFIFTVLEYLGVSFHVLSVILLIINFILSFLYSYKNALKTPKNGYKSGIVSSIKLWIIFIFLNIIMLNKSSFKSFIYYLIILLICIIGGITGKNKQKKLF